MTIQARTVSASLSHRFPGHLGSQGGDVLFNVLHGLALAHLLRRHDLHSGGQLVQRLLGFFYSVHPVLERLDLMTVPFQGHGNLLHRHTAPPPFLRI